MRAVFRNRQLVRLSELLAGRVRMTYRFGMPLWTEYREIDFIREVVARLNGEGNPDEVLRTIETFGTVGKFLDGYSNGLRLRWASFDGREELSAESRAKIRNVIAEKKKGIRPDSTT